MRDLGSMGPLVDIYILFGLLNVDHGNPLSHNISNNIL